MKVKRRYKGAGFAWIFGVMMVLVVAAVFLTGAVSHYDTSTTIVSRSIEVYDTVHVSEFLKRTLDGASFVNGKAAVRDLAPVGGGIPVWTNNTPTLEELAAKLEGELEKRMDGIDLDGLGGREISWEPANVTIEHYSDESFGFFGTKPFIVESKVSTPQVMIGNLGAFESRIESSYFKLLKTGLDVAACPPTEGERTYKGLEVDLTATGNATYSVSLLDKDSGLELRYTLECPAEEEEAAPEGA